MKASRSRCTWRQSSATPLALPLNEDIHYDGYAMQTANVTHEVLEQAMAHVQGLHRDAGNRACVTPWRTFRRCGAGGHDDSGWRSPRCLPVPLGVTGALRHRLPVELPLGGGALPADRRHTAPPGTPFAQSRARDFRDRHFFRDRHDAPLQRFPAAARGAAACPCP